MILSREDVVKYRSVIDTVRDVPPDILNRIYGHLHADTCQQLWAKRYGSLDHVAEIRRNHALSTEGFL